MNPAKPLAQVLADYAAGPSIPFHMPGHKRRALHSNALPWTLDVTELPGLDNLHDPTGLLAEAMARAAALWGSEEAYYLVNGSTGGILAALHASLPRGGSLLVARNCHKSVYHALELLGLEPTFLRPPTDPATGLCGSLSPADVEAELAKDPQRKALFLTSPTYDGVLSDLPTLCALCHRRGVAVLVDEAHGSHLGFGSFSKGAVAAGADLVVHSLHKTLPSLTQTGLLHRQGTLIRPQALRRALALFQTSSPSYPLMASIDGCVNLLAQEGTALTDQWLDRLSAFDEAIGALNRLRVLCHGGDTQKQHPAFFAFDPSKLVISTRGTDLTGPQLATRLREDFHLELEMAGADYALAMTGLGDGPDALPALAAALCAIDHTLSAVPTATAPPPFPIPQRVIPAGAALELPSRAVPRAAARGQISAEYLWAYPPGIPLIVPGEVVDEAVLAAVDALTACGVTLHSTTHPANGTLLVLETP